MKQLRVFSVLALSLAAVLLAAACGSSDESVPNDAVAVVAGEEIPREQFDALLEQTKAGYKQQGRDVPKAGTPEYTTLKTNIVQYLVQRAQFEEKAKELGITVTDKQMDDELAKIKKDFFGGQRREDAGAAEEAEHHARLAEARHPREADPGEALREGHRRRHGHRQGHQGLLRPAQGHVRAARVARRPAHPRQRQGARRQALRAARRTARASPSWRRSTRRTRLGRAGRQADDLEGPDRARVRQARLRAQDRRARQAGQDASTAGTSSRRSPPSRPRRRSRSRTSRTRSRRSCSRRRRATR